MNGDPAFTKVEQFNTIVRAICVMELTSTFCLAFLWGVYRDKPVIAVEAFVGVLGVALTWWFKSRDEKRRRTDAMPTTTTTTPRDDGPIITKTEPTPAPPG